jgi:hypothetical protein
MRAAAADPQAVRRRSGLTPYFLDT